MWRLRFLAVFAGIAVSSCSSRAPRNSVAAWYPLQPGNQWIYQNETLDGDMTRPDVQSWTMEETIISAVRFPELDGTLVTKRIKVTSGTQPPRFFRGNDFTQREPRETRLLVHQKCVYLLDTINEESETCVLRGEKCLSPLDGGNRIRPEYREDLIAGKIPGDYCFPMDLGMTWGKGPNTSPAEEFVWLVKGLNADPFGVPGGRTFHMFAHEGSGAQIDRWFAEGIGVIQEVGEHHGTFDENRRELLSATVNGKTRKYQLTPARVSPFGPEDCDGPRWQHFSRSDGDSFTSIQDCMNWSARKN
jgi:hypothetical protein